MISAIVLAAGRSQRMGRPKMSLAWEGTTILGHVVDVIHAGGVEDVLVVSGADREAVESIARDRGARAAFNPRYAEDEMLSSLQAGLRDMPTVAQAALIALGDQPQIQQATVQALLAAFTATPASLIVPSYRMRRGHPWLVRRSLWETLLSMSAPETPRDFLHRNAGVIAHVEVDTPTILADLDTPEDYRKNRS